jgi:hypothetical protein
MIRFFIFISFGFLFYCCAYKKNSKQVIVSDCLENRTDLLGNKIPQKEKWNSAGEYFFDPIDDTIGFRKLVEDIYIRNDSRVFKRSISGNYAECKTFYEFFKDISSFIDTATYRILKGDYFSNKGKVYIWWANSDGDYPCEVVGADPETFEPFKEVAGGKDNIGVYYGGPPDNLKKINGANPATIKVLKKKDGCWNCSDCYFVDDKNVFFSNNVVVGSDPKSFQLISDDSIDAKDNNFSYFEGKVIGKRRK